MQHNLKTIARSSKNVGLSCRSCLWIFTPMNWEGTKICFLAFFCVQDFVPVLFGWIDLLPCRLDDRIQPIWRSEHFGISWIKYAKVSDICWAFFACVHLFIYWISGLYNSLRYRVVFWNLSKGKFEKFSVLPGIFDAVFKVFKPIRSPLKHLWNTMPQTFGYLMFWIKFFKSTRTLVENVDGWRVKFCNTNPPFSIKFPESLITIFASIACRCFTFIKLATVVIEIFYNFENV